MAKAKKDAVEVVETVNVEPSIKPKAPVKQVTVSFGGKTVHYNSMIFRGIKTFAADDPMLRELRNNYTVIE